MERKQPSYYQHYFSALTAWHEVVNKGQKNDEGWCWLVKTYLQREKLVQAKEALTKAAATVYDELYYRVTLSEILLNEYKVEYKVAEAQNYFQ